ESPVSSLCKWEVVACCVCFAFFAGRSLDNVGCMAGEVICWICMRFGSLSFVFILYVRELLFRGKMLKESGVSLVPEGLYFRRYLSSLT
ncbi:2526_t:CDS:2, partial [Gigaspora rosea]